MAALQIYQDLWQIMGQSFCYENNIKYSIKEDEYDESKALGIFIRGCRKILE